MNTEGASERIEDLVALFLREHPSGGDADVEAFARRHPAQAAELRRILRGIGIMEKAAEVLDAEHLEELDWIGKPRRTPSNHAGPVEALPSQEVAHANTASTDFVTHVLAEVEAHGSPKGRYSSEGEIARGGQGVVLAARDATLRRRVAMKVALAPTGDTTTTDARSLGRFLEEAQVTAQLDHPGIVPVHDLGLDAERRVYFTMKLVKGRDLRMIFDLVQRGEEGWTRTRALNVLLKVCEAMSYAHSKSVIHRDLKPSNVMVGKFGEVYVMDWGLARVLGSDDKKDVRIRSERTDELSSPRHAPSDDLDSPLVTMDGDVVGTPAFMSPEQARGETAAMGPHSDVYAVGAMLYQLLTGQMPYVPNGAMLSSRAIWALVHKGPPDPVNALAADVPPELEAICAKAMARVVTSRYADMSGMAEDLRAYLEHRVVSAHETGPIAELRKWVGRNKMLAASMASVFLAVVAGMVVSFVFKTRADRRADDVLRLSALQDLEDLTAEADRLWPARPENVERYRDWLRRAEDLVAGMPEYEARLAALRSQALPRTEEEAAEQRASHARLAELETTKRHAEFLGRLSAAWKSNEPAREPTAGELGVNLELPAKAAVINGFAWARVDPERKDWGGEAQGLVLARRAVALSADLTPAERAPIRDTLAWALFAAGRFDQARVEEEKAMEEAGAEKRSEYEGYLGKLRAAIEEEKSTEGAQRVADLEERIVELEAKVSERSKWTFADSQDRWWHNQLEKLLKELMTFSDSRTGLLSSGTSPDHGWGIRKRLEFASTIEEQSVSGAMAAARWSAAVESIADVAECPQYAGLRIVPQLGLLPIGRDPESGLWEFAHIQTGAPAERGTDGRLVLQEETGFVFVLLPGGTFTMGSQRDDPTGPNYDPQSIDDEGPPQKVTLSPFLISKYEMTQGQWLRFVGHNPSRLRPEKQRPDFNSLGKPVNLFHPVEQVSWDVCQAVLQRMELLLPTEAQWEYAARAGTTSAWWTGEDAASLEGAANVPDRWAREHGSQVWGPYVEWNDGNTAHAEVGTYRANAFGLHDVAGNEWEWCRDGYGSYLLEVRPGDGERLVPSTRYRVYRGGSFAQTPSFARSALRGGDVTSEDRDWILSLRPSIDLGAKQGFSDRSDE